MQHHPYRRSRFVAAGVATAMALTVAACGSDDEGGSGDSGSQSAEKKADAVAVLLPDTKSSTRWETQDRPLLEAAFKEANVPVTIQNAERDKSTQ